MKNDESGEKSGGKKLDEKKSHNFTAKPHTDTQNAILRNLYIPKLFQDKIKKPDTDRNR